MSGASASGSRAIAEGGQVPDPILFPPPDNDSPINQMELHLLSEKMARNKGHNDISMTNCDNEALVNEIALSINEFSNKGPQSTYNTQEEPTYMETDAGDNSRKRPREEEKETAQQPGKNNSAKSNVKISKKLAANGTSAVTITSQRKDSTTEKNIAQQPSQPSQYIFKYNKEDKGPYIVCLLG